MHNTTFKSHKATICKAVRHKLSSLMIIRRPLWEHPGPEAVTGRWHLVRDGKSYSSDR